MLKAAIFDPYLDTLGGGERYVLTVAEILLNNNYNVDIFWSGNKDIISQASERFSLNLSQLRLVPDLKPSIISRFKTLRHYDLLFYISDGSVPFLFSKINLLHFQVPFNISQNNLLNKFKFLFISHVVCNSKFTQKFFLKNYHNNSLVLYPPIDIEKLSSSSKENIILSVGRFDNSLNAKRQDILIDAFKKLSPKFPNWKLVLAGGSLLEPSKNKYLQEIIASSKNFPIEFLVKPKFEDLKNLYSKSKIFWHAAGFGVNENLHPENTEHFGMVVVEAMASGLVPLVVSKGGLPEIISDGKNGYLWDNVDTLVSKTSNLIESDIFLKLQKQAIADSTKFSKIEFKNNLLNLIR